MASAFVAVSGLQTAAPAGAILPQALRQAGMRDRHWEQLSQQLNMPLKPDKDFVLAKALDLHLMDHLDTIQKVTQRHWCHEHQPSLGGLVTKHHRHSLHHQLAAAATWLMLH